MKGIRNKRLAVGILMALAAWAGPVTAQTGDRLEQQLQDTDEALARAGEIVHESRSERAREALDLALRTQEQAWEQFRTGRLLIAARLTRDARNLGMRAVTLARGDADLAGRAEREIERAAHAWDSARAAFDGPVPESALPLLDEAQEMIERARGQAREQHYEVAIRLAVSAQRLVRQAVGSDLGNDPTRVERELERTESLLDRVRDAVTEAGHDEAARLLEQAFRMEDGARAALHEGRVLQALGMTRDARTVANRAAELVRGPMDAAAVDAALAETDRLLDHAADMLSDEGDERALALVDRARDHQVRARAELHEGDPSGALAQTRVARGLAKRALQIAGSAEL